MIHIQSTCACFALCIVHVSTNTTYNTIDVDKARRRQSPLCARICSLFARAMPLPSRVFRTRVPGTCLHVPCPCLQRAPSSVCTCLPCWFSLHTVDVGILLRSDIALARVFKEAPMHQSEHPADLATVVVFIFKVIRPQTLRLSVSCFCLHDPCSVLPQRASFCPISTT